MMKEQNYFRLLARLGYVCIFLYWICDTHGLYCEGRKMGRDLHKSVPRLLKSPAKGILKHSPTTWQEAKKHCQEKNKTLFDSVVWDDIPEIVKEVVKYFYESPHYWIKGPTVKFWTGTEVETADYPFFPGKPWLSRRLQEFSNAAIRDGKKPEFIAPGSVVAIHIKSFDRGTHDIIPVSPSKKLKFFCTSITSLKPTADSEQTTTDTGVTKTSASQTSTTQTKTSPESSKSTTESNGITSTTLCVLSTNSTITTSPYSTTYNSTTTPYISTTTPYISTTTPTDSTTTPTNSTTTPYNSTTTPTNSTTTPTNSTTIPTNSTTIPTNSTTTPTNSTMTPTNSITTTVANTAETTVTSNEESRTSNEPPDATVSSTTNCKGRTRFHNGIKISWPDTEFEDTAEVRCPRNTFGTARWMCNKTSRDFVETPEVTCRNLNCSENLNIPIGSKDYRSYIVEREAICDDNGNGSKVMVMMKKFRDDMMKEKGKGKQIGSYIKDEGKKMQKLVSSFFGMYDRLMDKDAKFWKKMKDETCKTTSMELIKETEEAAWIMGCMKENVAFPKDNLAVQIFDLDKAGDADIKLSLSSGSVGRVRLPRNLRSKSRTVCDEPVQQGIAAAYKNMELFLNTNDTPNRKISSGIIGVSLDTYNSTFNLPDNEKVRITLYHDHKNEQDKPICVFLNWNKDGKYGIWDERGCNRSVSESGSNYTVCECDHLTNFAILMDFEGTNFGEEDTKRLCILTRICCGLSSIALLLIVIVYLTVKSLRNKRSTITFNMALCLLWMNILVQTGLERAATTVCKIVSALLQYFVLSAFCWMLLEGALLYRMVILVFETTKIRMRVLYALAYGIPFVIVSLSSSVSTQSMIREDYCWPSAENGHIWSVVGPIVLVISVNLIIFFMTLNAAFKIDKINSTNVALQEKKKALRQRLKGMVSLMCLLGFTWLFGFFHVPNTPVKAYLFVIISGFQGVFLFITQLVLNDHARNKLFVICKENMARFTSATSSWNILVPNTKPKSNPEEKKEQNGTKALCSIYPPLKDCKDDHVVAKPLPYHIDLCKIRLRITEPDNYPKNTHPFAVNLENELKSKIDYVSTNDIC